MADETDVMLSTYDNPFNPFTQFEAWWKYDLILGHDCCGLLARTSNVSEVATQELYDEDVLNAINYIVEQNPEIYRKVTRNDYKERKSS